MDFLETIVVYDLKLATDDLNDKKVSVDIKTLSPGDCMPLPRGYIHEFNHEKNCINTVKGL